MRFTLSVNMNNKLMNTRRTAYLLWLLGFFVPLSGLHRFYNGKILTGVLWLCTWGLLGFGQVLDVFFIPGMVESHNAKRRLKQLEDNFSASKTQTTVDVQAEPVRKGGTTTATLTRDRMMLKLLHAAQQQGGYLSVTQGVMATGADFAAVEAVLNDMLKSGYVGITNDPETGIVLYDFKEL